MPSWMARSLQRYMSCIFDHTLQVCNSTVSEPGVTIFQTTTFLGLPPGIDNVIAYSSQYTCIYTV